MRAHPRREKGRRELAAVHSSRYFDRLAGSQNGDRVDPHHAIQFSFPGIFSNDAFECFVDRAFFKSLTTSANNVQTAFRVPYQRTIFCLYV